MLEKVPYFYLLIKVWDSSLNFRKFFFIHNLHCSSCCLSFHAIRPKIAFRQKKIRVGYFLIRNQGIYLLIKTAHFSEHCVLSNTSNTGNKDSLCWYNSTNFLAFGRKSARGLNCNQVTNIGWSNPWNSLWRIVFRMACRRRRSSNYFT